MVGLYSSIVGKKRSDYDNLGYPRSRTAPGWFTSGTGLPMSSADAVIRSVAGMEPYCSAADSRKKRKRNKLWKRKFCFELRQESMVRPSLTKMEALFGPEAHGSTTQRELAPSFPVIGLQ